MQLFDNDDGAFLFENKQRGDRFVFQLAISHIETSINLHISGYNKNNLFYLKD